VQSPFILQGAPQSRISAGVLGISLIETDPLCSVTRIVLWRTKWAAHMRHAADQCRAQPIVWSRHLVFFVTGQNKRLVRVPLVEWLIRKVSASNGLAMTASPAKFPRGDVSATAGVPQIPESARS